MTDDERRDDAQTRRNRVLEQDLAHYRRMAEANAGDPAFARETALWVALAREVEAYLRPPVAAEPSLFDGDPA